MRIRQGFAAHRFDFSEIGEGYADNLKITLPSHLKLAGHFVSAQGDKA